MLFLVYFSVFLNHTEIVLCLCALNNLKASLIVCQHFHIWTIGTRSRATRSNLICGFSSLDSFEIMCLTSLLLKIQDHSSAHSFSLAHSLAFLYVSFYRNLVKVGCIGVSSNRRHRRRSGDKVSARLTRLLRGVLGLAHATTLDEDVILAGQRHRSQRNHQEQVRDVRLGAFTPDHIALVRPAIEKKKKQKEQMSRVEQTNNM